MNYLRRFNEEMDNESEILETIRDICLDLTDDGLKYEIRTKRGVITVRYGGDSVVVIYGRFFGGDEVDSTIRRLENYLKSEGIYGKTNYSKVGGYSSSDIFDSAYISFNLIR